MERRGQTHAANSSAGGVPAEGCVICSQMKMLQVSLFFLYFLIFLRRAEKFTEYIYSEYEL